MARPLAFDPQEKLHQAMLLFWRQGYESTSVQDLVDELQINRFSLYNTFGDKEALFEQVVRHYRVVVFGRLEARLHPISDGLPRLFAYLEALRDGLKQQPGPWGCLLQNTLMERSVLGDRLQPMVDEFVEVLYTRILAILNVARDLEQLTSTEDPRILANFVTTHIQGMIMMSRSGVSPHQSIEMLRRLL